MGLDNRSAGSAAAFVAPALTPSLSSSLSPARSSFVSTFAVSSALTAAPAHAARAGHVVNKQPSAFTDAALSDDPLPVNTFLRELRREERRAERSGRALSLLVYRFDAESELGQAVADRLLKAIYATKRETDVVGHLPAKTSAGRGMHAVAFAAAAAFTDAGAAAATGAQPPTPIESRTFDSAVAVLCPDTAEAGLGCLKAKISKLTGALSCTVAAAIYPDDLFRSLSAGAPMPQAFASLHAMQPYAFVEAATGAVGEAHGGEYGAKRALDILGASLALVLLALPMGLIAAAVAYTSAGSPIFKQTRVGKGGVLFTFYKFRSMVVGGDDRIHRNFVANLLKADQAQQSAAAVAAAVAAASGEGSTEAATGEVRFYKLKTDPRVTPLGRFIRKTSIDELPQLFNVLKGDMSLVGPRPPIPYESAQYQAWHLRRILAIKPGITGLWQVEGRSNIGFSDMVRLDLRYLRDCSFRLDMKILWKTVGAVMRCDGAA